MVKLLQKTKKEAIEKFSTDVYTPHQMQNPTEKEKRNWYKHSFKVEN